MNQESNEARPRTTNHDTTLIVETSHGPQRPRTRDHGPQNAPGRRAEVQLDWVAAVDVLIGEEELASQQQRFLFVHSLLTEGFAVVHPADCGTNGAGETWG